MIMFWHRRKLLDIETQLKEMSSRLEEDLANGMEEIRKENCSLRHTLEQIERDVEKLAQGQEKVADLVAELAAKQWNGEQKIVGMAEAQRDSTDKLLDLIRTQGNSMQSLHEVLNQLKESQGQNRRECSEFNEKLLNALQDTECTIAEKVAGQGVSVIDAQNRAATTLSNKIEEILKILKQEKLDSIQYNDQLINKLKESERTVSEHVAEQTELIQSDMESVKSMLLHQDNIIHEVDISTKQINSDMGTLDEAMRLLLVNTLLNNMPEK